MAGEVKTITSEALEAAYRALTPSQSGFTQDLQASNTIIPVLDLTADASGTNVPEYQQQSLAFGSQTAFDVSNTTTSLSSTPGFYRIVGVASVRNANVNTTAYFSLSDGLTSKKVWGLEMYTDSVVNYGVVPFDLSVFLAAGESISAITDSVVAIMIGSIRQTADVNGVPVNPSGFTPQ
jgi:hypothetical protein